MRVQATKLKLKTVIIIAVCIAVVVSIAASVFIFKELRLSNAIKNMDIGQKQTVTRVIKLSKNDTEILLDIAEQYIKKSASEGAGILMHILQNIDCENERARALLKEYYTAINADPIFISQVDFASALDTDFDVITSHSGVAYGGTDGIYCSDFDGLIKFKISGARAKSMSAFDKGVYFLDFADGCVKTLSYDGAQAKTVLENVAEFVYFEGFIYSIDINGNIHSPNQIQAKDGELFGSLRVAGDSVLCNVYNQKRELIDTLTLN